MCGIGGFQVAEGKPLDERPLSVMQASLFHRGPDAAGRYVSGDTGLVVTRLAIVDLDHGDQPLFSPRGRVVVANGEIYNAPELRPLYPDYPFQTGSDCEVILPLYERFGTEFSAHLRGMYGIALYDPTLRQLIISRDPFGIKPLYYVEGPDFFAFASEPSALLEAGFAGTAIGAHAKSELLQLKYVTGTKTIFPDIQRIEPGATVVVQNGKIVERKELSPWASHFSENGRRARPSNASQGSSLRKFTDVISDSVSVHLRADANSCLFYSGGIDSTILMRVARKVSDRPIQALAIGYDGRHGEDESVKAVDFAKRSGVECTRLEMTGADFWNLAPRIAAAMDDPMADPAVLPLYMLGRAASRAGFKIALSGEGADEVFGGYSRYKRATLPKFLRRSAGRRGVFGRTPISVARFNDWDEDINLLEAKQSLQWASRLQVLQAVDILERLPNCLLIKLDRALMANGVEGRTPFLDKEVVAFAAQIPDWLKASMGMEKRLLRDWLAAEFPEAAPYARKQGFEVPLAAWMEPRQRQIAQLVANQPSIAEMFQPTEVEAVFGQVGEDKQPAWSLLFYALWHSHHVLGVDSSGDIGSVLSEAGAGSRLPRNAGTTVHAPNFS